MWVSRLRNALKSTESSFSKNELSFQALTSKPEAVVRDRLGFTLFRTYSTVAKEWRERFDLAITTNTGDVSCLIELKAIMAFDVINRTRVAVLPRILQRDQLKLQKFLANTNSAPECFQLLLITHPLVDPTCCDQAWVKYVRRTWQDRPSSLGHLRREVRRQAGNWAVAGYWWGGDAFGIPTVIHYFLYAVRPTVTR
jgi:hypothetical protein